MRTVRIPIHRQRHRGFNFAEVLFAVMILGVGFIMVAAMFPVAIQQSRTSTNETVAARVAEAMIEAVRANATNQVLVNTDTARAPTGEVRSPGYDDGSGNPTAFARAVQSHVIYQPDPAYGCTVLYRRPPNTDWAHVTVVVMQVQNRPAYDETIDLTGPTFLGMEVFIVLEERLDQPDRIYFYDDINMSNPIDVGPAAPGAIVVVAFDGGSGRLNGRAVRLARHIATGTWELQPGWDLVYHPGADASDPADDYVENVPPYPVGGSPSTTGGGFLIGRGLDPSTNQFEGGNQAIAVYSAIVPIRP